MEAKIKVYTGTEVKVSPKEVQKAFLVATKTLDLFSKVNWDKNIEGIEITWKRERVCGVFYGTEEDYYTDFLISIKSPHYPGVPEYFIKDLSVNILWEHTSSTALNIKRVKVFDAVDNETYTFLGLFVLPDEKIETLALALLEGIRIKMLLTSYYLQNQVDSLKDDAALALKEHAEFLSLSEGKLKLKFTSHYGELDKILAP